MRGGCWFLFFLIVDVLMPDYVVDVLKAGMRMMVTELLTPHTASGHQPAGLA